MGLAAGQARLLTITARKSDCEYESMRLSHQKIALSRELSDLSNEYQNSLDQTKLVYDYYGTGDTSTPLSYGLLMSPSTLNDYLPITVTDSLGRVTLNSKYAAAARAAGIPQEGLGSLPSEAMRNAFVQGLYTSGILTKNTAETILGLPYNQQAGFGGGVTTAVTTKNVTFDELAEVLSNYSVKPTDTTFDKDTPLTDSVIMYNNTDKEYYFADNSSEHGYYTNGYTEASSGDVTLGDILTKDYTLLAVGWGNRTSSIGFEGGAISAICNSSAWENMFDAVDSVLGLGDAETAKALEYARTMTTALVTNNCDQDDSGGWKGNGNADEDNKWHFFNDENLSNAGHYETHTKEGVDTVINWANEDVSTSSDNPYIGFVVQGNADTGHDDKNNCQSVVSISVTNILKAYLTYFMDYMNGVSKEDANGNQVYSVGKQESSSNLVDETTTFIIRTGSEVSSDDLGQATFYDALFNQICSNGWTENNQIEDNEYLKEMLQSGMLYISKIKDDGYYYQANYATDSYIKEISDETAIAQAEAKYTTEKAKLNSKEETLDLKMKNLDTEISSLSTEYDTVKNTISKNIEKSFKRYNA